MFFTLCIVLYRVFVVHALTCLEWYYPSLVKGLFRVVLNSYLVCF